MENRRLADETRSQRPRNGDELLRLFVAFLGDAFLDKIEDGLLGVNPQFPIDVQHMRTRRVVRNDQRLLDTCRIAAPRHESENLLLPSGEAMFSRNFSNSRPEDTGCSFGRLGEGLLGDEEVTGIPRMPSAEAKDGDDADEHDGDHGELGQVRD